MVLDHLISSLSGWLLGMLVGVGIGYLISLIARRFSNVSSFVPIVNLLLPWRAAIAVLVLIVLFTPAIAGATFGPFMRQTEILVVGLTIALFVAPITAGILTVKDRPLLLSLVSMVRTFAVASVVITLVDRSAVWAGGNSGLSYQFFNELDSASNVLLIVFVMCLAIDLVLGIVAVAAKRAVRPLSA
jgi:hypothetical protein